MPTVVNNILAEWNEEVEKARRSLHPDEQGAVYLMSLTRRKQGVVGGVMACVYIDTACKLIAGETHREATSDEISAWQADQARRRKAQLDAVAAQATKMSLDMQPIADLVQALTAASRPVQPPVQPAQPVQPPMAAAGKPAKTFPNPAEA